MIETLKNSIKYLHIMPQGSLVYDGGIIEMINKNPKFDEKQHIFLVYHKSLYEKYENLSNVIFAENTIHNDLRGFVNWIKKADVVFLHSNILSMSELYRINKKLLNKIIWCVWGHDLYIIRENSKKGLLKRFVKAIVISLYNSRIKQLLGIGIGYRYDALEVRARFGHDMRIFSLPYFASELDMSFFEGKPEPLSGDPFRIMIGHSSYPFLNHKKILDKLLKYKEENIIVSLVLSYGDMNYAKEVADYAKKLFGDKAEIISSTMNLKSYIDYLKTVDAAVFDHVHQSALANIFFLLYLEKKLFLNKNGILAQGMRFQGAVINSTDIIGNVPFKELKAHTSNKYGYVYAEYYVDNKNLIRQWEETIQEIDELK